MAEHEQDRDSARPGARRGGTCPLCGPVTMRVLSFRYRFRDRFLLGVRCPKCSLVSLDPMPSDEEIASLYTEEYFTTCSEEAGAHGPRAYTELIEEMAPDRRRTARQFDQHLQAYLGRRGRFYEVGCGPGYFLEQMRVLGWDVGGLEISEYGVREARARLGIEVTGGALVPGSLPSGALDAVFLGDVLEHLPRPLEALREVHQALRPDGVLIIAVPSTLNLASGRLGLALYSSLGRYKTLRIPPYHLVEYTPATLRRVLQAAGFRVLQLRQSAVPLRRMGLRGNALENAGKAALQMLAHVMSRIGNTGGDRLLAFARREDGPA